MGLRFSSLKEDKTKKYKKLKQQNKRKKKKKTVEKGNVSNNFSKERHMQRVFNEWLRCGRGVFDHGSKLTNLANLNNLEPSMRKVSNYGRNNQVRFVTPQINQPFNQHAFHHRPPQQFGNTSHFKNFSNNILSCNQNIAPMQPQKITAGIVLNNGRYEEAFNEGDFVGGRYCSEDYRRLNKKVEKMNSKVPSWLNKKKKKKEEKLTSKKSVKACRVKKPVSKNLKRKSNKSK